MIQKAHAAGKLDRLRHRHPEPVLADVDVERAAARPPVGNDKSVPLGELDGAVDDGSRIKLRKEMRGARMKSAKHVDDRSGATARTRLASARLVTKNVRQPDLASASATGSMPQP